MKLSLLPFLALTLSESFGKTLRLQQQQEEGRHHLMGRHNGVDDDPERTEGGGAPTLLRSKPKPPPRELSLSEGTICKHSGKGTEDNPCVSDVVIVGAGAAGVSAAAYLRRRGQKVTVLEASTPQLEYDPENLYGTWNGYGRARAGHLFGLAAKIDIGGEWVHTADNTFEFDKSVGYDSPIELLQQCLLDVNNNVYGISFDLKDDEAETRPGKGDHRWVDTTWFDFIDQHIVKHNGVENFIERGQEVHWIESSSEKEDAWVYSWSEANNRETVHKAQGVIVTVPIKTLKNSKPGECSYYNCNKITFNPPMPASFWNGVDSYRLGYGIKAWLEFRTTQDEGSTEEWMSNLKDPSVVNAEPYSGQILHAKNDDSSKGKCIGDGEMFFNEMTGHPNDKRKNVIGFFAHGDFAQKYASMNDDQVVNHLMDELRKRNPQIPANAQPISKFVINWSNEPYINTGYTLKTTKSAIQKLQKPYHYGLLYFAGEHVPVSAQPLDCGFMNGAINSGKEAAKKWYNIRRR